METVLIVDDSAVNLYLLQSLLTGHGYAVKSAANGAEALEQARRQPPDMVVADILMPVMDGFELCRHWKSDEALKHIPFVFYTATYTDPKDEQFALSLGADRFVVKPQEPDDLLAVIEQVFAAHRAGLLAAPQAAQPDEAVYYRRYNETLIRKLEQRTVQLEQEVAARGEVEVVLRESEARHRRLFETMRQGVIYRDREGRITDANPAAEKIMGMPLADLRGRRLDDPHWRMTRADGSELPLEEHPSAIAQRTGQEVTGVIIGITAVDSGLTRWADVHAMPISRPGEAPPHEVYSSLSDITERRRAEMRMARLNVLKEDLLRPGTLSEQLQRVTDAVVDAMEADFARVWITNPGDRCQNGCPHAETTEEPHVCRQRERCLHLVASSGRYTHTDSGAHARVPFGCYKIGRVAVGLEPSFITNDVTHDPRVHDHAWAQKLGLVSFAGCRLASLEGEPIGVLALFSKHPIGNQESLILEQLADTTGRVIHIAKTEAALRESEELLRRVVHDQTEMLCRMRADGTITFANDAFARFFSRTRDDLVGRSAYDLMPEEVYVQVSAAVERLTPEAPVAALELPFAFADGRSGWTHWAHRATFDEVGQMVDMQATGADVTRLKMAEEEHRLAAIGQLAAGVAHDFNNLLQGMGGMAQLVELGRADSRELAGIVLRATRNGSEITRNLMAFARLDEPRRESGRLEASLDAALAVAGRQLANADIRVIRQYPSTAWPVIYDTAQMEQVFLNLIINASHAMPTGGTLTISTEYPSPDAADHSVVIRIADSGVGIAPDHLDRIFEPFFTTKGRLGESDTPGSGLGLSVSHGIVTTHGGTITVSSEVGVGTTFEIRLPLPEGAAAAAPAGPDAAATQVDMAKLKGVRVLVAEDEDDVLALLQQLFGIIGAELVTTRTTAEAIAALNQQEFDLVLSDLMMPGGGGRAVVQHCRAMGPKGPRVVIMSGRLERALHEEVVALGASRTIEKPFDLSQLLRLLADMLG